MTMIDNCLWRNQWILFSRRAEKQEEAAMANISTNLSEDKRNQLYHF